DALRASVPFGIDQALTSSEAIVKKEIKPNNW
ncbi:unnamed protein product, partial [marine sediment metagenome]